MTRTGEVQPGPVGYCSSAGAHAEGAAPSAQSSRAVVLCQEAYIGVKGFGVVVLVWRRWSWTAVGASTPLRAPSAFQG